MNKRSILSFTLATTLFFGGVLSYGGAVSASGKLNELENKKSEINNKKSSIEESINEKNQQISEITNQQDQLDIDIEKIDQQISDTNHKIDEKEVEISETKAEIEKLKEEIEVLKARIEKRNEVIQERARNIQQNGGTVKIIDVLLGAESFGDLVDRATAVTTLVNADKQILEEQQADKEKLEEDQRKVEEHLNSLNEMLKELENLKADLNAQNEKKKQLLKELDAQKEHMEHDKLSLEEEQELLAAQESAVQKAIQLEKERITAEEAARKNQEAEAAAAKSSNSSSSSSSSSGSSSSSSSSSSPSQSASVGTPPVTSGTFMKPADAIVTSEFGHRWGRAHRGIDISRHGTVPIVAAADGVVSLSTYHKDFGNVVYISHSIDGKVYTTLYGHMRSRSVSSGQVVKKGQLLGYMGSTGRSTGQHLHFEIWENGNRANAVNPRKYVNF